MAVSDQKSALYGIRFVSNFFSDLTKTTYL